MNKEPVVESRITLGMYLNDVKDGTISLDQDVQRKFCSKNSFVDGLCRSVLTGDYYVPPIIMGEVPIGDGIFQTYVADGVQRTSALLKIRYGNHRIGRSMKKSEIEYQERQTDSNGNIKWEKKIFDLKNKTFNDFPKELKDRFDKFLINTATYQDCTMEKVSELVRMYNDITPMNASQKAFTYLSNCGDKIKMIAASGFFKNCLPPSKNAMVKGIYEKAICESYLTVYYPDEWKAKLETTDRFINEHATAEELLHLKDDFDTLEYICDDQYADVFSLKNVPVWLAVFDRFRNFNVEESAFCGFIDRFKKYLSKIVVDEYGTSFDQLDGDRHPKSKKIIIAKINVLTYLMEDYFSAYISNEATVKSNEEIVDSDILNFVQEHVSSEITSDDISDYYSMLDEYAIDKNSCILDWQNEKSMLAIIAYSFYHDIDLDNWIKEYSKKYPKYISDQDKNFLHMKENLEEYIKIEKEIAC